MSGSITIMPREGLSVSELLRRAQIAVAYAVKRFYLVSAVDRDPHLAEFVRALQGLSEQDRNRFLEGIVRHLSSRRGGSK